MIIKTLKTYEVYKVDWGGAHLRTLETIALSEPPDEEYAHEVVNFWKDSASMEYEYSGWRATPHGIVYDFFEDSSEGTPFHIRFREKDENNV